MILSIVTLNYKKPQLTLACIASLYKQYTKELTDGDIEILIVDNDSGKNNDTSIKILREAIKKNHYLHIRVIQNKENGFGKGCNIGAKEANGKYILFLNNDTQLLDHGLLDMVAYFEGHPLTGILGGRLLNEDSSIQPSTGKFYSLFNTIILLLGGERFGFVTTSPVKIMQVDWVSGGSMMILRDIFEKIEGFDENIFMYVEDVDICFRVKRKGFAIHFYPYVSIMHKGQGSSNRSFAIVHIYEGLLYFYKKYMPKWQQNMLQLILVTKAKILIVVGKFLHNTYLIKTYEEALTAIR